MAVAAELAVGIAVAAVGWWLFVLGNRFESGRYPPRNYLIGTRTEVTLASDAAWSAGQRSSGPLYRRMATVLIAGGVLGSGLSAVVTVLADQTAGGAVFTAVVLAVVVGVVVVAMMELPKVEAAAREAGQSSGESA